MTIKSNNKYCQKDYKPSRFLVNLNNHVMTIEEHKRQQAEIEKPKPSFKEKIFKSINFQLPKLNLLSPVKKAWFFVIYPFAYVVRFVYFFFREIKGKKEEIRKETVEEKREEEKEEKNEDILPIEEVEESNFEYKVEKAVEGWIWKRIKPAFMFALLTLAIILPLKMVVSYYDLWALKGKLVGVSEAAADKIMTAAESAGSQNWQQAQTDFSNAGKGFTEAKKEIEGISGILQVLGAVIPNEDAKLAASADKLLEAGRLSAEIGEYLSRAMSVLSADKKDVGTIVKSFELNGRQAYESAQELNKIIASIDPSVFEQERLSQLNELNEKSRLLEVSLGEFMELIQAAKLFLGFERDTRYLLVFQNNTEMRGSGGFIGSYALADFRDGKIINLEIPGGGSYDTEAGLKEKIAAPDPLCLVNPLWHFWDANWWPDWPMSARKLMWFYEKSDGPTVDGVISLTPTVMERMLTILGPLDLTEKHGVTVDSENFWQVTQTISEQKPWQEHPFLATNTDGVIELEETASGTEARHEPKKIIGDLMDAVITTLPQKLNRESFVQIADMLDSSLSEKHILFYFTDPELQTLVQDRGWDGAMRQSNWDYLMVTNTNIAGAKSDQAMVEDINLDSQIDKNGRVVNTLTITRKHTAKRGAEFTGVRNVDWMRIYVPEGARLLNASGFGGPDQSYFEEPEPEWKDDPDVSAGEGLALVHAQSGLKIYDELGKTVFAGWSQVEPGETITVTLKYELPFVVEPVAREDDFGEKVLSYFSEKPSEKIPYSLLVEKQPGSIGSSLHSSLSLPGKYGSIWFYPDNIGVDASGWDVKSDLKEDKYFATILEVK